MPELASNPQEPSVLEGHRPVDAGIVAETIKAFEANDLCLHLFGHDFLPEVVFDTVVQMTHLATVCANSLFHEYPRGGHTPQTFTFGLVVE